MIDKNEQIHDEDGEEPKHLGLIEEDSEDDKKNGSVKEDKRNRWFHRQWIHFFDDEHGAKGLYTNYTIILMWSTMAYVMIFLSIQGSALSLTSFKWYSYTTYLVIFIVIFVFWLLLRAIWMTVAIGHLTESRVFVAINVVLDPDIFHLGAAVTNLLFCAYIPSFNAQTSDNYVNIFGTGAIPKADFKFILKTNLIFIIWAAKDLLCSIGVFWFLTGLLMTLNGQLVKFLTLYRVLKKLNLNWNRVRPAIAVLELEKKKQREKENKDGSSHYKFSQGESSSTLFNRKQKSQRSGRCDSSVRSEKKHYLDEEVFANSSVEYIPSVLLVEKIAETSNNAVANLLTLEYCRQYPCSLYRDGIQVRLIDKSDARAYGRQMFDEMMHFVNVVAPKVDTMDDGERCAVALNVLQKIQQAFAQSSTPVSIVDNFWLRGSKMCFSDVVTIGDGHGKPVRRLNSWVTALDLHGHDSSPTAREHSQKDETFNILTAGNIPEEVIVHDDVFRDVNLSTGAVEHRQLSNHSLNVKEKKNLSTVFTRLKPSHRQRAAKEGDIGNNTNAKLSISSILLGKTTENDVEGNGEDVASLKTTKEVFINSFSSDSSHVGALYKNFFGALLDEDVETFMSYLQAGGRGYASRSDFINMFVEMYEIRKQLLTLLTSQEVIRNIISRLISAASVFLSVLLFFMVTGVSPDTIIASGVAVFSSCAVILSFFYTGLVHAILYVCMLNPYNVGDRVVMNNTLRTVKKVHTYFTEFYTVHGKIETINHSVLFEIPITNESRAKNAGIYLEMRVDFDTPDSKILALNYQVELFIQHRHEFVKDSFFFYIDDIVIGNYKQVVYFATAVDSWGMYLSAYYRRGLLIRFIIKECKSLGIKYELPLMPVTYSCA